MRNLAPACFSMLLTLSMAGQTKPTSAPVDVELAVRGPNGLPVVHTNVLVEAHGSDFDAKIDDISTQTNDKGIAYFKITAGVYRLAVKVHGVGHGDIGTTEFITGQVARPQMAPLAAYGSLDGTFPVDSCQHDVTVRASNGYFKEEHSTLPDSPGHFHISDVPSRYWLVEVFAEKKTLRNERILSQRGAWGRS